MLMIPEIICSNAIMQESEISEDGFLNTSTCNNTFSIEEEEQHYSHNNNQDSAEIEFQQQQQLRFDMLQSNSPMVQELDETNTWIDMNYHQQQHFNLLTSLGLTGHQPLPDDGSVPGVGYDPLFPLNLPPQPPPPLRDLFHTVPHGHILGNYSSGALFSGVEDGDVNNNGVLYHDSEGRPLTNGVFHFTSVVDNKDPKHLATDKQRRVHINDRYKILRNLIPKPTKIDRASIVEDAIGYINELKMTVNELKIIVERKKCGRERMKRQKNEDGSEVITVVKTEDIDGQNSSALRSSWLQRKSKNTEVDVRIIDDEVTVKLVQQKRFNSLLFVSKVLDELQLDLHHVAGGLIGDYYSFLFNSKIYEGSSVYAHAIANKLIDAMDKQYATTQPNT